MKLRYGRKNVDYQTIGLLERDAEISTGEHSGRVLQRSVFSSVLYSTLIVMFFQILFKNAHGIGHLVTASTQLG